MSGATGPSTQILGPSDTLSLGSGDFLFRTGYTTVIQKRHPTTAATGEAWPAPDASLVAYVEDDRRKLLKVYGIKQDLIEEHFNIEQAVLSSGYRYRQVFEVIQNTADAILEAAETGEISSGRVHVRMSDSHLYVGNTGACLTKDGIRAPLGAHSSPKRRTQIGRFGLGFKSLLALDGRIELFSRSVFIRFDPAACQAAIAKELGLSPDQHVPRLRMAELTHKAVHEIPPQIARSSSDDVFTQPGSRAAVTMPAAARTVSLPLREVTRATIGSQGSRCGGFAKQDRLLIWPIACIRTPAHYAADLAVALNQF